MPVKPYSDEEIEELIAKSRIDITQPMEFKLNYAINKLSSKSGNPMIEIEITIPQLGENAWALRDWLMIDSDAGMQIKKIKDFMRSIGLEAAYMAGETSTGRIMSRHRGGSVMLDYVDNEYKDKVTGEVKKNKKYVIKEYIKNKKQEKLDSLAESGFVDDVDIPF